MSRIVALITVFAAVALTSNLALADLVASIGTSSPIFAGDTGTFEVFLENTVGGPATDAALYEVGFDIVTPGELGGPFEAQFTGTISTANTTEPYIFPTSVGAAVTTFNPADPTELAYGDFNTPFGTFEPIAPGDRFSLGFVTFTGSTPGTYSVNFTEAAIDSVPVSNVIGATITVLPAAVPEATTTLLLLLTGVAGLFVARLRRRRSPGPVAG